MSRRLTGIDGLSEKPRFLLLKDLFHRYQVCGVHFRRMVVELFFVRRNRALRNWLGTARDRSFGQRASPQRRVVQLFSIPSEFFDLERPRFEFWQTQN